jgi:microcystin degradation protein MlrC
MRIGIVSIMHESNTFIGRPTTWERFEEDVLLSGEDIRRRLGDTHHEIGGYFAGLAQAGAEAVPIFAARATPYGTIADETFERLAARMLDELAAAGPLDGLLAAMHGAAVSERFRDADGEWLSRLRSAIGKDLPLIATLDAHANLSGRMVRACNAITVYRTNPHLDQRERGEEASDLMVRTVQKQIRPRMAATFPAMATNIERQCTSESHWQPVQQLLGSLRRREGVLSASVVLGFPYADVEEMGAASVVVTDGDQQVEPQALSDEIASCLWEHREAFRGSFLSVDEAVHQAEALPGPVCLLDMGDNVGGGSPADGTWIALALQARSIRGFVCLYDPHAVEAATAAGVGGRVELQVGGHADRLHGPPLADAYQVEGLFDGRFEETLPRHGGARYFDQGATAVVQNRRGLTLMLTSRRVPPFSLKQLTSFGIRPADFQVLVAKGVNAPLAAYREVCPHFLRVDTPGVTSADMRRLAFQHRRRPLFPLESPDDASLVGARGQAG